MSSLSRRAFLSSALAPMFVSADTLPPVRAITSGPKFHWFGYYDKWQFDPTSRRVLGMEVEFEHRSPRPTDAIKVGVIDLETDRWTELGQSLAWNWQQGCMLQWVPGSRTRVLWNDRQDGRYVCHLLDTATGKRQTVPSAVYAVHPNGKSAIAADFRRLNDVRPGYGYAGIPDPSLELAPRESGIWTVDLTTGKQELILSVSEIARFGTTSEDMKGAKHWFNHLLFSPDGSRFIFLHRWRPAKMSGFRTRMLTARSDGKELYVLDPSGHTSHFIWRDNSHVLAWTNPDGKRPGFYLFEDRTDKREQVGRGIMTENGHCTYLPGNEWILNDTYPDTERRQHVYLFHVKSGRRVPLGHFLSPKEYTGEWRCDTHPRFSPDGKKVIIDSPHGGGRQMYLIDVSKMTA